MSKFKAGDKVHYIGGLVRRSFRSGTVYEVGGMFHEAFDVDRCGIVADDQGEANGLPDSNFRLVDAPPKDLSAQEGEGK